MKIEKTDVLIIGAGPVGIFTVFQCGMLGLKTHIVDAQSFLGGQCAALYPEKPIYDIPAMPSITGGELIEHLFIQANPFNPNIHLNCKVIDIKNINGTWTAELSNGKIIHCDAIIISSGAGLLRPNKPALDDIELYEGTSVFYSVKQKEFFENKKIVIAGGGDSAADWAVELTKLAKSITVIHRRNTFRAVKETQKQMLNLAELGKLTIIAPAQISKLYGQSGHLNHVEIDDLNGNKSDIDTDTLLLFFGLTNESSHFENWGLSTKSGHIQISAKTCATNLPGVFAAGDVAYFPGKLNLILSGFSEAATAAHNAFKYCRPNELIKAEYSTAKGIPV